MMNAYVGVGQGAIHPQHQEVMAGEPGTWLYLDKFVRRGDVLPMDGAALAFADDSLGCVYASHVLEHFSHRDTRRVLNEWYRVLKPDGKLIVNVPDFDWACMAWLNPAMRTPYFRDDQRFLEVFFGGQDDAGEVHFTGFTAGGLRTVLLQVGFLRVDVRQFVDAHDMQVVLATAIK
jgi:predicted SAM-dependent methyltransferase